MRMSDWSSDVCSSDLHGVGAARGMVDVAGDVVGGRGLLLHRGGDRRRRLLDAIAVSPATGRPMLRPSASHAARANTAVTRAPPSAAPSVTTKAESIAASLSRSDAVP